MSSAQVPASAAATSGGHSATSKTSASKSNDGGTAGSAGVDQSKKPKKPRRKKTTAPNANRSSGASSQSILQAARMAQTELNSQKAIEAARKKDPLWYQSSDVLSAISPNDNTDNNSVVVPGLLLEQVDLVERALASNHLSRADVTPQAFGVLLEQARRYALELVADAQDYAYAAAAHSREVSRADLLLAYEMRPDTAYQTHTLGDLQRMTFFSHNVNRKPLPPIPSHCYHGSVLLPPEPHQLTARTYDVVTGARVAQKMIQKLPTAPIQQEQREAEQQTNKKKKGPSYGATQGRQIPINLKQPEGDEAKDGNDTSQQKATSLSHPGDGSNKRKADELSAAFGL